MNLREIAALVPRSRAPAPYGVRRRARCHSIDDLARLARRRLPAAVAASLDGGGEDEYTLRRNPEARDIERSSPRAASSDEADLRRRSCEAPTRS